jgi:hypothetical protein
MDYTKPMDGFLINEVKKMSDKVPDFNPEDAVELSEQESAAFGNLVKQMDEAMKAGDDELLVSLRGQMDEFFKQVSESRTK